MPYLNTEIEITKPLPTLCLPAGTTGVGILVRRGDRPVGFLLEPLTGRAALTPDALARLLIPLYPKLLRESVRDELMAPPDVSAFPSLTIAVCTKDRPALLTRCLEHVLVVVGSGADRLRGVEILVVDNAPSTPCTQAVVGRLDGVRYVHEPRAGLDFARNRALEAASGELLAFIDDDVTVDRGWLAGLQEGWAQNPDAAAFTGLVLPYELETEAQIIFEERGGFRRGFEKLRYQGQSRGDDPLYPCGAGIFGAGCNMAFRREVVRELGGFDEALDTGAPLPGGGDLDMFYRVIRAGYPLVYEPRYLVFHQHRRDHVALRRQYWSWGLGFMAFLGKTWGSDPSMRSRVRGMARWWFRHQLGEIRRNVTRRHRVPIDVILAELGGGVVGLCGEYGRSRRRVADLDHRGA